MNNKNLSQNSDKKTNLIIISPGELAKLGLFKDVPTLPSTSSQKTIKKRKNNSSASSSTASQKQSESTSSDTVRTEQNGNIFKKPETSLKQRKTPVTSKPIENQKLLGKKVLKNNLEEIKKIMTESIISRLPKSTTLPAKTVKKKEVKVISDNLVSLNSKELMNIVRSATVKKDCVPKEEESFSKIKLKITNESFGNESKYVGDLNKAVDPRTDSVPSTVVTYIDQQIGYSKNFQMESSENQVGITLDKELEKSEIQQKFSQGKNDISIANKCDQIKAVLPQSGSTFDKGGETNTAVITANNLEPNKYIESNYVGQLSQDKDEKGFTKNLDKDSEKHVTVGLAGIVNSQNELGSFNGKENNFLNTSHKNTEISMENSVDFPVSEEELDSASEICQENDCEKFKNHELDGTSFSNDLMINDSELNQAVETLMKNSSKDSLKYLGRDGQEESVSDLIHTSTITEKKSIELTSQVTCEKVFPNKRRRFSKKPVLIERKKNESFINNTPKVLPYVLTNPSELDESTDQLVIEKKQHSNKPENIQIRKIRQDEDILSISEVHPDRSSEDSFKNLNSDGKEDLEKEPAETSKESISLEIRVDDKEYTNTTLNEKIDLIQSQNKNVYNRRRYSKKPILITKKKNIPEMVPSEITTLASTVERSIEIGIKNPVKDSVFKEQQIFPHISVLHKDKGFEYSNKNISNEEKSSEENSSEDVGEMPNENENNSQEIKDSMNSDQNGTLAEQIDLSTVQNEKFSIRRKRQHKIPVLVKRKEDEAATDNLKNITMNNLELDNSVAVSTKVHVSQSVFKDQQNCFPNKASEGSGKDSDKRNELKKEIAETVCTSNVLKIPRALFTENDIDSLQIIKNTREENNVNVTDNIETDATDIIKSFDIINKNSLKRSLPTTGEIERKYESTINQPIQTSSDESSLVEKPFVKLAEDAESIILPKVVKKRGRPRKKNLESSILDVSIESVGILNKTDCNTAPKKEKHVGSFIDIEKSNGKNIDKSVGQSTSDFSFTVKHSPTPLKKRGRPKKSILRAEEKKKSITFTTDNDKTGRALSEVKREETEQLNATPFADNWKAEVSAFISDENADCPLSIVKKKGRPKKQSFDEKNNMKLECIQVDGEKKMENLEAGEAILNTGMKLGSEEMFDNVQLDSLANVNAESTFTNGSTKIPKKRGRPKKKVKSDHIISEPVLTHPMEESMRGRKCKRVDYLKLEDRGVNILKIGQSQEPQKNSSFDNDDNFIPTKKTSGKKKSKVSDSLIEIDRRGEEIPLKNEAENNIIKSEDTTVGTVNADVEQLNATPFADNWKAEVSAFISDENADCPLSIVKKKGRPKKQSFDEKNNMKLECIQVDGEKKMENLEAGEAILNTGMKLGSEEMFDSVQLDSLANVNAESTFTNGSTKIPKKRGRQKKKFKSDHIISEPVLTHPMEESMRGRKRKRVDYLELEDRGVNILKRGQSQEPQKNSSFDNDDNFIPTKKTSGKKKSKVSDSLIEIDRRGEEIPLKNEAENNIIKSEDTTVGTVNADVDTVNADVDTNSIIIPMDPSSVIPENEQTDRQSNEDVTENSNVTVKNKYTFNGHTSYMMNSVFSAAFGGDSSPSTSSQDSTKKKRKGRPKKDAVNTFSDEVEVTCVICSEIMPNREWFLHNVTKHNNLAWRKGESALNLDEDSVVKNKLKIILPKNKILTCQKCEQSYKDVNGFIIHREECEGILVNGLVTCAVCNLQVERKNWLNHKMKRHNNLAWRVGDFPLDLNDKEYVLSVLNNMYKMKKPLFCDRCETVKKSVIGFLSHRSQCGDHEAKVACDICRKMVLPVSMPSHIKLYHEKAKESPNQSNYFSVDYKISDHKRKAAKDALLIIDSLTKRTMNMDESQTVAYKKNPVDFKEEQFVIALLESELKKCLTIKCKFQNCIFWTDNVDTIVDHMNSCSNKPEEFYICTECFVIQLSEEDIRSHITDSHDLFLPIEDCEMETDSLSGECHENEQTTKKIKRKNDTSKLLKDSSFKVKPSFICNIPKKKRTLYAKAFSTTWEFCSKYYSEPTLFDNFCYSNLRWELLPEELVETYLPEDEESCDVARKSVSGFENILEQETEFRKFDLFEVVREDVHTTIYCGGPINALAWLPTPYTARNANQILAVAAGKNFDGKYSVKRNYNEPSVIQFWDFGLLANKGPYPEPSLLFFLAVDYGPIWYLEWCPSGCYDQTESEVGRTGLLAVAGSDFCVYIYLIPKVTEEQRELVYRGKPLLRLQIMRDLSEVDDPFYPTRISWSKASGHRHVAVGYTDGMVALYDLQTTSPFLRLRLDEDTDVIYPCKIIQAHSHYISVLSLIHLDGGTKYLLTGSFDRSVKLWDLPITHAITTNVKKIVTDGHWLTNWVSYVITSDESSSVNNLAHATIYPHRNYLSSPTIIGSSPTTITSITSSDWLNGFVHSSSGGEIVANFQHQLLYCYDSVKQKYLNKYIISYTKLVDKHKSPEVGALEYANKRKILKGVTRTEDDLLKTMENVPSYQYPEPLTYGGAKHKYGLVFCDLKLNSYNDFPESLQKKFTGHHEDLEVSNPTLYSLQKANKVCFNPNCQASLYFATGYQAGFVRVSYLKFLENDPQVKQSMK